MDTDRQPSTVDTPIDCCIRVTPSPFSRYQVGNSAPLDHFRKDLSEAPKFILKPQRKDVTCVVTPITATTRQRLNKKKPLGDNGNLCDTVQQREKYPIGLTKTVTLNR